MDRKSPDLAHSCPKCLALPGEPCRGEATHPIRTSELYRRTIALSRQVTALSATIARASARMEV